jgi:hypothetical protein
MGEDFDSRVQSVFYPKFRGYRCGFLFQLRVTRTRPKIQFIVYFVKKWLIYNNKYFELVTWLMINEIFC